MSRLSNAFTTAIDAFKSEMAKPTHHWTIVGEDGQVYGTATMNGELVRLMQACQGPFDVFKVIPANEEAEAIVKRHLARDQKRSRMVFSNLMRSNES